jgi:hypothetical protein
MTVVRDPEIDIKSGGGYNEAASLWNVYAQLNDGIFAGSLDYLYKS